MNTFTTKQQCKNTAHNIHQEYVPPQKTATKTASAVKTENENKRHNTHNLEHTRNSNKIGNKYAAPRRCWTGTRLYVFYPKMTNISRNTL